jgi:2-dehydro-3-deoxyphosphogluconate aldolase/(4S)-4-hydroxy-2-oxoglutarate aldolase
MTDALSTIESLGVVPVATIDDAGRATGVADALVAGGLPCIEVTLRTDAGVAAIEKIASTRSDVLVGAGTVLDATTAQRAVAAGAAFVVSPGFDDGVVEWCTTNGVPVLPGVVTPTEMMRAIAAGLRVVKFFPAHASGGPDRLRATESVFPDLRFVPTGGIGPRDLESWLDLHAVVAVGGSWMVERALVADGNRAEIESRAADAVRRVASIRDGGR